MTDQKQNDAKEVKETGSTVSTVEELEQLRNEKKEWGNKEKQLLDKIEELEKQSGQNLSQLRELVINKPDGGDTDKKQGKQKDSIGEEIEDLTESDISEKLYGWDGKSLITKNEVVEVVNALEGRSKKEITDFIKKNSKEGIKLLQEYLNDEIKEGRVDQNGLKKSLEEKGIPFDGQIMVDGYLGPQTLETIKYILKEQEEAKDENQKEEKKEENMEYLEGGDYEWIDSKLNAKGIVGRISSILSDKLNNEKSIMDIIDENKKIVIDEKEFLEWESGKEDVCYRIIDNQIIIGHFDKDGLAIGEIILIDDKYLQVGHMKNGKKIGMWIGKDIESIKINEDFDSIHLEIIKNKEEVKEGEEGKEKEKEKDKGYGRFECQLLPIQEEEFRIKSVEDYAGLFGETIPEELKKYDDDFFNNGGILSLKYFVRDNTASPTHNIIDIKKEDNTINVSYETENSQSSMGGEVITGECLFIETKIGDSVTWNEVAASDNTNDTNNKGSDVQETEPTNNNLDMKAVETLGTFNGNTFEFTKEPLVDSDNKKYIEINGNKYYEYEEDMNKDGYLINNEKGCIYIGGFKSGAYDGKGVIITRDGDRYEGEFKDGNMEGKGIFIFANGSKYEGEVKENDIEGQGVRTYPNGNKFEGKSACNKMISGKYTIKAGDEEKVYEVIRENGMFKIVDGPDSVGKYLDIEAGDGNEIVDSPKFINLDDLGKFESEEAGNDYKFSFNEEPKNDEKGKYIEFEVRGETEKYYEYQEGMTGKLYRIEEGNDDEIVPYKGIYIGNFEDGKKQGFGAKLWGNGVRYEGEWEDDKPNGRGIFYNREMRTYEGERKDNKKEGYGIETWEDGTRYEGERENDKLNGQGTIFYVNGNRYEGEFVDDAESNGKYTVVEPEEIAGKYEVEKDEKGQKIISGPEGSVGKYMHSSPDPEDWKIVD